MGCTDVRDVTVRSNARASKLACAQPEGVVQRLVDTRVEDERLPTSAVPDTGECEPLREEGLADAGKGEASVRRSQAPILDGLRLPHLGARASERLERVP